MNDQTQNPNNHITLTCLFGNGFDIALGLKTSFVDFVSRCYLPKYKDPTKANNPVCNRLADQIAYDMLLSKGKTWADAEMNFARLRGDEMNGVRRGVLGENKHAENFKIAYDDFSSDLKEYLKKQDEALGSISDDDWKNAGRTLLEQVVNRIDEKFRLDLREVESVTCNFITLNYTRSLDLMVQKGVDHRIRRTTGGRTVAVTVGKVLSAHGRLDGDIIFGVDDLEDIVDPDVREACKGYFLKDSSAWMHRTGHRIEGCHLIEESDYILLFGVACGKSDAEWWRKIYDESFGVGKKLRILVCDYDKDAKKTYSPSEDTDAREICRRVFAAANPQGLDENLATFWQRMGVFKGRDILEIGNLFPPLKEAASTAAGPEVSSNYYEDYLKGKKSDTFATDLHKDANEKLSRPKIVAQKPDSDTEHNASIGEKVSRQKVYAWHLSEFLKKEENSFSPEMLDWLEANADDCTHDVLYALGWLRRHGIESPVKIESDKVKAVKWYTKAAEKGNVLAQFNLGVVYDFGEGVAVDKVRAVQWYTKAADQVNADALLKLGNTYRKGEGGVVEWYTDAAKQGVAKAQFTLGVMYSNGEGVAVDKAKAAQWFTKAAEQGHSTAQLNLGYMYDNGKGVTVDKAKAVEWYTKAAEQGEALAQYALGYMYANGEGVVTDKAKAVEWYTKAAEQGEALAQFELGYMYSNGDGVAVDKAKAVDWYTKAAEQGYALAQYDLGYMYSNGDGAAVDKVQAVEWYTKAAEQGDADAQLNLGYMYDNGEGVPVDKAKAAQWYTRAAELGLAQAQVNLGETYRLGEGVAVDKAQAAQWYTKAAEQGLASAQFNLSLMYYNGYGVAVNKVQAVEWCTKAAEQGLAPAQRNLGYMYDKGEGVAVDKAKAVEWYTKAAEQGDADAQHRLGEMYRDGEGVAQSDKEAEKWFRKARENGYKG